jgi:nicotinamide mononucleotide (NMN) deamidase PncC
MLNEKLKEANVNVHIIATGAGAGIQQALWATPGSSAYLSGATFPYSTEETEELLGFKPESFCSREAAIDLASAAYMKAYRFGTKKTIGLGLTASVASEKEHRGDHRCHICVISDDQILCDTMILTKGVGSAKRLEDGMTCDGRALEMIEKVFKSNGTYGVADLAGQDALKRFLARPFFTVTGQRLPAPSDYSRYALMPGAYNPPHDGHYGMQEAYESSNNKRVLYEVTANPPHKGALSVQELLQRAKMLQGHDRIFTWSNPMYLDKARAFPGMPILLGADAMVRMLDPKWGVEVPALIDELYKLGTHFYINGRTVDGKFTVNSDIIREYDIDYPDVWKKMMQIFHPLSGRWDLSSTEIRNKVLHG